MFGRRVHDVAGRWMSVLGGQDNPNHDPSCTSYEPLIRSHLCHSCPAFHPHPQSPKQDSTEFQSHSLTLPNPNIKPLTMQLIKSLALLGALAIPALAQDDSSCDPQNDDNNDATCTSSMAGATPAMNSTVTSTDANGRLTTITNVATNVVPIVIYSTNIATNEIVSTNPKSV